jgi:predicted CXXCH cytochrome family protein
MFLENNVILDRRRAMNALRSSLFLFTFTCLCLAVVGAVWAQQPTPAADPNQACIGCHSDASLKYTFPSGEEWSLYVDPHAYGSSIHGQKGLYCTACHPGITQYPHPTLTVSSTREYQLAEYQACSKCHSGVYQTEMDSIHGRQLAAGNTQAPVCSDCHNAHDTTPPDEPRTKIALACSKCHSDIYQKYQTSVHGKALVDEANRDVPTCTDCHGVHSQEDPHTTSFRLNSPQLCARCHADAAMMSKYGISTNVFDTYVADFHGKTVSLFQRLSPDIATNKPVCYDCHGVHEMQQIGSPDSSVARQNLLTTCRRCHPTATANFPSSWLGHYEPNPQKYPLVYFVQLFYAILIPLVLGAMALFVLVDFSSRWIRRWRGQNGKEVK